MEKQTEIQNESQNKPIEPVFSSKIGAFSVGIFLQEYKGRKVPGIKLQKSFTKDGENWEHLKMPLLSSIEVDKLICVLQKTKEALYLFLISSFYFLPKDL
ncbi:MAG: hypothetical protein GY834_17135 [Bacteroidetes bacterium]|nr:hypothetical protein [Bacteroidota bacterium]